MLDNFFLHFCLSGSLVFFFVFTFILKLFSSFGPAQYKSIAYKLLGYQSFMLLFLFLAISLVAIPSSSFFSINIIFYMIAAGAVIFLLNAILGSFKISLGEEKSMIVLLFLFLAMGASILFISDAIDAGSPYYVKSQNIEIELKEDSMQINRIINYVINEADAYRELFISLDYYEPDLRNIHKPELISYQCPKGSVFYSQEKKEYDDRGNVNREYIEYICRKENYYSQGEYALSFSYKINKPYFCGNDFCMVQYKIMDSFSSAVFNSKISVKNAIDFATFPKSIDQEVGHLPAEKLLEFAALVPANYANAGSFYKDNSNTKYRMENYKSQSDSYKSNEQNAQAIAFAVLFFALVLVIAVYLKYGKELTKKEIDVLHYVPEKQKPWFVNLIYAGSPMNFDSNAVPSTLLDLASREIIEIKETEIIVKGNGEDDYENNLLDFMRQNAQKKEGNFFIFSPEEFNKNLYSKSVSELNRLNLELSSFTSVNSAQKKILDEIYDNKGSLILHVFGVLLLIGSLSLFFANPLIYSQKLSMPYIAGAFAGVFITLAPFFGSYLFGRYKKDHASKRDEWNAFKNLLSNYGMIQKYKPQEIGMWKEWLVYATALGCADSVISAMKKLNINIPEIQGARHSTIFFYAGMRSNLGSTLSAKAPKGGAGGFGGAGGGFGGGGGGAR